MVKTAGQPCSMRRTWASAQPDCSEVPVPRIAYDEVAEDLQLGGDLHLIRIAEIGIEGWNVGGERQLDEPGIAADDIVWQDGDADPQEAGSLDRCLTVDLQV